MHRRKPDAGLPMAQMPRDRTQPNNRSFITNAYTHGMLIRDEGAIRRLPWRPNWTGLMASLLILTVLPAQQVSAQERSLAATAVRSERRVAGGLPSSANGSSGPTIALPANEEGASSRIPWVLLGAGTGAILGGVIGHNKPVESSSNPDSALRGLTADLNTAVGFLEGAIFGALTGLILHAVLRP